MYPLQRLARLKLGARVGHCTANGGAHNIYVEKVKNKVRVEGSGAKEGLRCCQPGSKWGSAWFPPHQLGPRAGRLKGGHFVLGPGAACGSVSGISHTGTLV